MRLAIGPALEQLVRGGRPPEPKAKAQATAAEPMIEAKAMITISLARPMNRRPMATDSAMIAQRRMVGSQPPSAPPPTRLETSRAMPTPQG
jgi:hypothetical protein